MINARYLMVFLRTIFIHSNVFIYFVFLSKEIGTATGLEPTTT